MTYVTYYQAYSFISVIRNRIPTLEMSKVGKPFKTHKKCLNNLLDLQKKGDWDVLGQEVIILPVYKFKMDRWDNIEI